MVQKGGTLFIIYSSEVNIEGIQLSVKGMQCLISWHICHLYTTYSNENQIGLRGFDLHKTMRVNLIQGSFIIRMHTVCNILHTFIISS